MNLEVIASQELEESSYDSYKPREEKLYHLCLAYSADKT